MRNYKKHTYEEVKKAFNDSGITLLETEYKNNHTPMRIIARCGHETTISFMNFLSGGSHGDFCKNCSKTGNRTTENIRDKMKSLGLVLLSEYKNAHSEIRYVAKCGHERTGKWADISQGFAHYCDICLKRKRHTLESVFEIFNKRKCKLLESKYKNNKQKLDYVASCGHRHQIKLNQFLSGSGDLCPLCSAKRSEKLLFDFVSSIFPSAVFQHRVAYANGYGIFDIFIPDKMVAIEYNGRQHYSYIPYFHKSKKEFIDQQNRDIKKREYCKQNGILLIEIDGRIWNYKNITMEFVKSIIKF